MSRQHLLTTDQRKWNITGIHLKVTKCKYVYELFNIRNLKRKVQFQIYGSVRAHVMSYLAATQIY